MKQKIKNNEIELNTALKVSLSTLEENKFRIKCISTVNKKTLINTLLLNNRIEQNIKT
ncbi:hypothetical protein [Lutibacter sp. Hel_I_33_5]|uniref:hypothetical protein n=1 Tax=Lutibacter sp. Hel_I_33_5 TaxID=1566289 RepID=UPI001646F760|nr:hypothetical protein [Lutibacter sp. Hel_I_33_5]